MLIKKSLELQVFMYQMEQVYWSQAKLLKVVRGLFINLIFMKEWRKELKNTSVSLRHWMKETSSITRNSASLWKKLLNTLESEFTRWELLLTGMRIWSSGTVTNVWSKDENLRNILKKNTPFRSTNHCFARWKALQKQCYIAGVKTEASLPGR